MEKKNFRVEKAWATHAQYNTIFICRPLHWNSLHSFCIHIFFVHNFFSGILIFILFYVDTQQQMTNLRIRQETFDSQTINSYQRQYWLKSSIFYAILMIEIRMHSIWLVFSLSFACIGELFSYWHFLVGTIDRNSFDHIDSLFVFFGEFLWYTDWSVWMCECMRVCCMEIDFPFSNGVLFFLKTIQPCTNTCILRCVCVVRTRLNIVWLYLLKRARKKIVHLVEVMWRSVKCVRMLWNPTGNNQIITILMRTKVNVRIVL